MFNMNQIVMEDGLEERLNLRTRIFKSLRNQILQMLGKRQITDPEFTY